MGIDSFVICRGYCGAAFHMNAPCSGNVTRAMTNYFTSHKKNLFWMCDKCAGLFENQHFRAMSLRADENVQSPLETLTAAITELRTEIKQLHTKPPVQPLTPTVNRWPSVEPRRINKRPRDLAFAAVTSEKCRLGSKQLVDDVVSVPICNSTREQKFWLYLSRIRPEVTDGAVCAMVVANLELKSNPEVVKLVPKDKDTSALSFVSFKIGLDPSFKSKALDPNTWPAGLMFREFEDYGSQKFRMPLKSMKPMTPLNPTVDASPAITPIMDC